MVAKGRKVERLDGGRASAALVAKLLGPTGNLRAPTVVAGDTVLVGFSEEAWDEVFC